MSTTGSRFATAAADELTAINALREAAVRTASTMTTGHAADAVIAAHDEVKQRCEALRATWFPRSTRLVVAFGAAYTVSPTGQVREVWRASEN